MRSQPLLSLASVALFTVTVGLDSPAADAAIYNVGPGGPVAGCEAATIEAAVALAASTPAADEIRLVDTEQFHVAAGLHLTNWSAAASGNLTLSGGWPDCVATNPGDSQTEIAAGAGAVITVDTTGANQSIVSLRQLLFGGSESVGLVVRGNSEVHLVTVRITSNDVHGVRLEGNSSISLDQSSHVDHNGSDASEGGGIFCSGPQSRLLLAGLVAFNRASLGGGLFASDGCQVFLDPTARFLLNEGALGAAVRIESGALLQGLAGGASFQANRASSRGGAIDAVDAGTTVELRGAYFIDNSAGFLGGALVVDGGAVVALGADNGCQGLPICRTVLYSSGLDAGGAFGSAAAVFGGGRLAIRQATVAFSSIDPGIPGGSVFFVSGAASSLSTESVEIYGSAGEQSLFYGDSGANLEIAFTTAASSLAGPSAPSHGVRIFDAGTTGRIYSSVFFPVGGFLAAAGAAFSTVDCLIAGTTSGLPAGAFVVVADPRYSSLGDGNLRPLRGSPAIDFCDAFAYSPSVRDLDALARGHDHPVDPNGAPGVPGGTQDAGAYELWELFADGFGSGDAARWSASVP